MLLVDGVVAGVWHQRRSGRRVAITVEPLAGCPRRGRRDLGAETERIGAFAALIPAPHIGTVTVVPA